MRAKRNQPALVELLAHSDGYQALRWTTGSSHDELMDRFDGDIGLCSFEISRIEIKRYLRAS